MLSQAFLPRKAADCAIMGQFRHTALAFSMTQGQPLLTQHWHSLLEHDSNVVASIFVSKGGQ